MSGWYKREPSKFIGGVIGLGPAEIGAYTIILDLIYQNDGPVANDPRYLGGILGCSVRMAAALVEKLIKADKIFVTTDGKISNEKAEAVIEQRLENSRERAESGAKGGRNSHDSTVRETRNEDEIKTTSNKNNHLDQAELKHLDRLEEKDRKKENARARKTDFLEWYAAYPRHVGRGQAEKAYGSARKTTEKQILLEAAQRFAEQSRGQDQKFIPHPATWLNGQRWLDGQGDAAPVGESGGRDPATFTFDDWIARIEVALAGGPWPDSYGNHPKDAKTQNPQTLARWYFKQFHPDENAKAVA